MNISKKIFIRIFLFTVSLICQWMVLTSVIERAVNNFSLVWWITSLITLYFAFPFSQIKEFVTERQNSPQPKIYPFVSLIILIALIIRVALMFNTQAFHTDEYLTAHFSYELPDMNELDWFGVYPPKDEWVSQFPLPYFLFQKIFFNIFGLSTLTMRFSNIPYILVVFLFLFLIAKQLYNQNVGLIAITFLTLSSFDLYLSRWSLHFISSTAVFLTATYFFILSIKVGKKIYFVLSGFFLGLCYYTYYSSYVAVPLLFFYTLVLILKKQIKINTLLSLLFSVGFFIYTISPLIVYALKVDNFFTQRTEQVKLINGSWSPYQNIATDLSSILKILEEQTSLSVKSLYTDGIGGHAGYWFGRLALFDRMTFLFIIASFLYFLYKIIKSADAEKIFLLASIFLTFVTGVILTFPPPAFHRASLVFPLITLIIAATIYDFYNFIKKRKRKEASFLLFICITLILIGNIFHFQKILAKEEPDNPDFVQIEKYLNDHAKRMVYIAAFESYGLGRFLFVRSQGTINSKTLPLDLILDEISKNQSTPLVILYPDDESIRMVMKKFPNTKKVDQYIWHVLLNVN